MIKRKKDTKKNTHFKCFKTNEKGILDINTKMMENNSPKIAIEKFEINTIENIRQVIQTIFNLGSHLCKGESR